ncbi:NAD-dependent epimerase/dehydratase family protein [Weeksellaceae bacterium KMM 9713]|uniref:NAD-dependent epimerase/dehydratase family protein n=1 Tax=Profundicola chukchiensis TaxID=2961959 RepID=A0A9X4MXV2_9FLAO|nr:NAD-dependent epimerase/dehydratase family protein [Profundicola chukchiensis]MDG4946098.1 NAD-dependent epimerase/dehydratase family protein [Profundicola chukchiensis]
MTKILVTGALGQIGSELAEKLAQIYGSENVLITDIREPEQNHLDIPYQKLDVNDEQAIKDIVINNQITEVYHLAAMLSATAEKYPIQGWNLNTNSLLTFLELAKDKKLSKIFWPSSIAVFGRGAAADMTPQEEVTNPLSMYGVAKVAGEGFCEIYHQKYGVDVRSIRYPGLISWKTLPGGGTTDYAVDIYYKALEDKKYESFIGEGTALPMMYMDDAIRATIELMQAPKEDLTIHTAYNLQGITFTPEEIAAEIKKHISDFEISYAPDYRQAIADSWPNSIDDTQAQKDWNWKPEFDLDSMTVEMLKHLKSKLQINV